MTTSDPLLPGELVEVRSEAEILATLDENGELDGLPFMPEMLAFCGRRFRVYRRADKTCDTITGIYRARRMYGTVHLEMLRCDGAAHGGCQADCLLFWKEAWLKRAEPARRAPLFGLVVAAKPDARTGGCTREELERSVLHPEGGGSAYRCQTTELLRATDPLPWWSPGQYLRDWLSGNARLGFMLKHGILRVLYAFVYHGRGHRLKRPLYDAVARLFGEPTWPFRTGNPGHVKGKAPVERLDLAPGDWVKVKSHEEILKTLKPSWTNRGLTFTPEMVQYCGGTYRVRSRVERLLDEKTGKMVELSNDCITLENVICRSECSKARLFCPRALVPYWREIWLERVEAPAERASAERA